MPLIKPFSAIARSDAAIAGGKGASLGEMTQAGIPVPPGFVVLATAFERFLRETELHMQIDSILHQVKHQDMASVEAAAAEIKALILNVEMPQDIAREIQRAHQKLGAEFVAVRSSATAEDSASAAWAGQLDTFLNTTAAQLLEKVQHCWASLFTPRAIFYRFEKNLHEQHISVAVVVQEMVASEVSGIAFSVHPVTEDHNQLIIEAGYGLGEAIVSGQITPDSFVVEKDSHKITEKNTSAQEKKLVRAEQGGNVWQDIPPPEGTRQKLSDGEVLELAQLIIRIEQHYGFPVDVEWARAKGKWFITQSRPITTLGGGAASFPVARGKQESTKKPIDLIFTRDFGLATADFWRTLLAEELQRAWGMGIPDQIVHCQNGTERYFRLRSDMGELKAHTIALPLDAALFSHASAEQFRKKVIALRALMAEAVRDDQIQQKFTRACSLMRQLYPWYMLSIFVPGPWAEEFKAKNGPTAERCIALQYENRVRSEGLLKEFSLFLRKLIGQLLQQHGIPAKLANVVRYAEVQALLHRLPPLREDLEMRAQGYVLIGGQICCGKEFTALLDAHGLQFEEADATDIRELRGTSAFLGKPVRGIVHIIFTQEEIAHFPDGGILVTGMTAPDYLPALRRAKAIVTDEGGVTCHAAITARELGKPCIIGTKLATTMLRTGDMVEVDADAGIVRKLKDSPTTGDTAPNTLQKVFSREHALLYFEVWYKSDSVGAQLLGEELPHSLFITKPRGQQGSVWYETQQMRQVKEKFIETFCGLKGTQLLERLTHYQEENWKRMQPYLVKGRNIETWQELKTHYLNLAKYWVSMNSFVWEVLDDQRIPSGIRETILSWRKRSERYNERADSLEFLDAAYPQFRDIIRFLTLAELELIIEGKASEAQLQEFGKRRDGCFMLDGKVYPIGELDTQLCANNLQMHEPQRYSDELRGTCAYGGSVHGTVRIVLSLEDMQKVQSGDVLVTPMISPDISPILRKVAALVTDEGGMMSHAAIVAREMRKPCVIGTKVATRVLKDGDLVEVDANTGMVRKL